MGLGAPEPPQRGVEELRARGAFRSQTHSSASCEPFWELSACVKAPERKHQPTGDRLLLFRKEKRQGHRLWKPREKPEDHLPWMELGKARGRTAPGLAVSAAWGFVGVAAVDRTQDGTKLGPFCTSAPPRAKNTSSRLGGVNGDISLGPLALIFISRSSSEAG